MRKPANRNLERQLDTRLETVSERLAAVPGRRWPGMTSESLWHLLFTTARHLTGSSETQPFATLLVATIERAYQLEREIASHDRPPSVHGATILTGATRPK